MELEDVRPVVASLFTGSASRTTRVGIEQELVVEDRLGSTVPVAQLRQALRRSEAAAHVGFEPGGQLELNLPPAVCHSVAVRRLHAATMEVADHLAPHGIRLHARAVDLRPEREVPLRLRSARYVRMQRHFDTIGPAGRRMMRRTASTQVCLDWWSGRAGAEQWLALHLAGPYLAAAFARSTGPDSRLATWLAVDPARTAFDGRLVRGDDPVAAYVDFAAGATRFVDGGAAAHVSTLFPPVRPRGGYLEVRFLDAQEGPVLDAAVSALAGIVYDDERRTRLLQLLAPSRGRLDELWASAADGDPNVLGLGRELVGATRVEAAA